MDDDDELLERDMNRVIGTAAEAELLQRAIEVITRLRIRLDDQALGLRDAKAIIEQLRGTTA